MGLNRSQRRVAKLPHDVYKAYDRSGHLLYVGISVNVFDRLRQHRYEYAAWLDDTVVVKVAQVPDRAAAHTEEARCIREDSPLHNVTRERAYRVPDDETVIDSFSLIPDGRQWVVL